METMFISSRVIIQILVEFIGLRFQKQSKPSFKSQSLRAEYLQLSLCGCLQLNALAVRR